MDLGYYIMQIMLALYNFVRGLVFGQNGLYASIKLQLLENREWEVD